MVKSMSATFVAIFMAVAMQLATQEADLLILNPAYKVLIGQLFLQPGN